MNDIASFLFELGTMRKIQRSHQQMLPHDLTDNIASHSYRVAVIAWFLAKKEQVDPYKTVMMALLHDVGETRSGDHNYVHKKYVKIFADEIAKDQFNKFEELFAFHNEYEQRETKESLVAKDADLLDQILLLKEYAHEGSKEAQIWLQGKGDFGQNAQYANLKTDAGRKLGRELLDGSVSSWWEHTWTSRNR